MYGNRFYSSYGETPPKLWCAAIARLDDNALKRGLANLANDGGAHPPTLPEFVAACKRLPPVRHLGVPQLEDQREPGRMSYAEWKAQQETDDE